MDETAEVQHQVRRVRRTREQIEADKAKATPVVVHDIHAEMIDSRAQDLAIRIWNGQSPDLYRDERIKRVAAGLEEQGFSMDGVELP